MQAAKATLCSLLIGAFLYVPLGAHAQQPTAAPATAEAAKSAPEVAKPAAPPVAPTMAPGSTAVPGWNNPPQDWNRVDRLPQYASVPGRETNVLIQETGHEWRKFRNGPLTRYGGILLLLPFLALLAFYLYRGPIKIHDPLTGRQIERFTSLDRTVHWTMAITFVVLALTGIVIMFGKYIILPWLGHAAFSTVTIASKTLHNFVGPLFMFVLVIFIILFAKDNLPKAHDWQWIPKFGGMLSGEHVPSGKFNAGEKALFWGLVAGLCVILSVSGLILDFPNWNQGREVMQIANVVHGAAAVFAIAMSCFHIYLGTIGMKGAYQAMKTGLVDETWAREHHQIWYNEVKEGKRPEKVVGESVPPAQPVAGD